MLAKLFIFILLLSNYAIADEPGTANQLSLPPEVLAESIAKRVHDGLHAASPAKNYKEVTELVMDFMKSQNELNFSLRLFRASGSECLLSMIIANNYRFHIMIKDSERFVCTQAEEYDHD